MLLSYPCLHIKRVLANYVKNSSCNKIKVLAHKEDRKLSIKIDLFSS